MEERKIRSAVVTGPTGAIGTALCRRLLKENIKVYAVVNPASERKCVIPEGAEKIECDISEYASLTDMIGNADAFFHLAWKGTTGEARNDAFMQEANVGYAAEAAETAGRLGCCVFIFAGSQAEYGRAEGKLAPDTPCFPENAYGIAKLCAGSMTELKCRKYNTDYIRMRVLSVYGPNDGASSMIMSTAGKILKGETPALTKGEQEWDYLYSDDAADAFYRCALYGQSGKIYTLGSGCARPLREYVEIMRDSINKDISLGFGEIPYSEKQIMHLEADITELTRDTGFVPEVTFEDGIRKMLESLQVTGKS